MKRFGIAMIVMLVGAGFLFAGGSKESTSGSGPLAITIWTNAGGTTFPANDNPVQQAIEKFQEGLFWDITDAIKKTHNLSTLNPIVIRNASINGRLYGVPRERPIVRRAFVYRRDWLKKLGLSEPKSIDDFYRVAQAFTADDPDGDGKNDTFGYWGYPPDDIDLFEVMFGTPNNWGVKNGQFIKAQETPQYLQALQFMHKMYVNKLMPSDYPIMDRSKAIEAFSNGKTGVIPFNSDGITLVAGPTQKINPQADVWGFSVLSGPNGTFIPSERGFNGILAIPKKVSQEKMQGILAFIDKLDDPPIANLMQWGIEGKHYNVVDGKAVPIASAQSDYNTAIFYPYNHPLEPVLPYRNAIPGDVPPIIALDQQLQDQMLPHAVPDPTEPLYSPTQTKLGTDLDQILQDAETKYVVGTIDDAGWQDAVNRWRSSGGDQIAKEFADAYAKAGGK
jgi:ABC-type glycerol-3-phosphate transport system substrate-binding protein